MVADPTGTVSPERSPERRGPTVTEGIDFAKENGSQTKVYRNNNDKKYKHEYST
jgi:hypothetical protein